MLLLLCVLFAIAIYLQSRFLSILKGKHYDHWTALGSPSLIMNNSPSNNIAVIKFLWKKKYLEINDPVLTQISQQIRGLTIIYTFVFIMAIIYFILEVWRVPIAP
jgi:hypothetical protein